MDNKCVNPFVHRLRFRKIDYFKIFIGSLFLFPIRVLLTALLFILSSMMAKVANHFLDKWKLNKDEETEWRNRFKKPCSFTLRVMFFIAGFYKLKVTDKGDKNEEKEAPILVVAPHTSPFDIISGLLLNNPSVVSRHDAVDIPFFGNILKLTDPVFVQRDSQSSRQNVINSVLDTIKYLQIVFFPEGTCSNRRALVQFKSGAFKPGIPVQPIALKYDQFGGPDTLSWTWDGPNAFICIWLTLCRWSTELELIKLPIYYPSEEEKLDPELYAKNVSKILGSELDLPNLCYSYDDVKYLKYRTFRSPVCLKFLKLCDKLFNQLQQNNQHFKCNQNSTHHKIKCQESNHNQNGRIPSHINKNQLFIESLHKIIDETIEKIELTTIEEISSLDDLISLMNLKDYPELCRSLTLKELYNCLKKVSPNKTHLKVILNLCDLRVHSLWRRLENSFYTLRHESLVDNTVISWDALNALLWLAFGIEDINRDVFLTKFITFDSLKHKLLKYCKSCVEENAKELLEVKTI